MCVHAVYVCIRHPHTHIVCVHDVCVCMNTPSTLIHILSVCAGVCMHTPCTHTLTMCRCVYGICIYLNARTHTLCVAWCMLVYVCLHQAHIRIYILCVYAFAMQTYMHCVCASSILRITIIGPKHFKQVHFSTYLKPFQFQNTLFNSYGHE